jgi:hypothetical protein
LQLQENEALRQQMLAIQTTINNLTKPSPQDV